MSLHRIAVVAALGLVFAALAAPAALAQQDLRNPDTRDIAEAASLDLRNPDTREMAETGSTSPRSPSSGSPARARGGHRARLGRRGHRRRRHARPGAARGGRDSGRQQPERHEEHGGDHRLAPSFRRPQPGEPASRRGSPLAEASREILHPGVRHKVIVIGGGVAGMSAAHELAVREDFDVVVYELRSIPGGKARSMSAKPGTARAARSRASTGSASSPGFYRHVTHTMSRIPYPGAGGRRARQPRDRHRGASWPRRTAGTSWSRRLTSPSPRAIGGPRCASRPSTRSTSGFRSPSRCTS